MAECDGASVVRGGGGDEGDEGSDNCGESSADCGDDGGDDGSDDGERGGERRFDDSIALKKIALPSRRPIL